MKKIFVSTLISIGLLLLPHNVFATANITLTQKAVTANKITITVKNNGAAGVDATGTYLSIFNGVVYAVNPTTHTPDNAQNVGPIPGGESRDVTVPNLNPATAYSMEVQDGGFYMPGSFIKKITVTTLAGTAPCTVAGQVLVNGVCVTPPPPPAPAPGTATTATTTNNGVTTTTTTTVTAGDECTDKQDNDGDGRADHYGVLNDDGSIKYDPDPACFSPTSKTETKDDVKSTIIPCTDKCTFRDVFGLLNNFLVFFITKLLIPIFIIIIMYAGFKFITAEGNPSKIANIKKMLGHIIGGIILMLCAWLIVHTIMVTVLNDDFKQSGIQFLGQ